MVYHGGPFDEQTYVNSRAALLRLEAGVLVDDAHSDAVLREGQGSGEPCGPGADLR